MIKLKSRNLFIYGIFLFFSLGILLTVSVFSNLRLQTFNETHSIANNLLLNWTKVEILTRKMFMTYELKKNRKAWMVVINQFQNDFQAFINSSITLEIIKENTNFQHDAAMIEMYWEVIHTRLKNADKSLTKLLEEDIEDLNSGNLLVDYGEDWHTGQYSENLIAAIEDLRLCLTLSHDSFTKSLSQVSHYVAENIQTQIKRLYFSTLLLIVFIFGSIVIFIMYRLMEMAQSSEASQKHASELLNEIEVRKHAEELLQSEREKLYGVLNAMGEGMYIVNRDFNIEYQNATLDKTYGKVNEERCFNKYAKSDNPCKYCLVQKTIESGEIQQTEASLDDGRSFEFIYSPFIDVDGNPKTIILWYENTEKKRIEAEVMNTSHLASIGELAAGVAHEINNPISGIISVAEILKDLYQEKEHGNELLDRIIKEGDRIAKIVNNLLFFSRNRQKIYLPTHVHNILTDSFGLLERQITKEGINLIFSLPSKLPKIKVQSQEIQQVFLNLISNARYALNNKKFQKDDKYKILEIRGQLIDDEVGTFVRVIFYDKGIGIPKNMIGQICNPFFSTKPRGKGIGLGLSICHGIIKSHGGRLKFQSISGEYTKVIVDLPVA